MEFNALIPELYVYDCKKSLEFYVDTLGFEIEYKREEEGFAFISYEKNAQLMLDQIGMTRDWCTADLERPLGRGINFQIHVSSLENLIFKITKAKIPFFLEPEEKWYRKGDYESGNYQFLIQDVDGYLLRFSENLGERKIKNQK